MAGNEPKFENWARNNEQYNKDFERVHKQLEKGYEWISFRCPYCGNDVLSPSDLWRHENRECTTASVNILHYTD